MRDLEAPALVTFLLDHALSCPHRCRKLLEVDFFSRCAAKGLLPSAAHKWNLGSLAWFLVYTPRSKSLAPLPPPRLRIPAGFGAASWAS